MNIENIYKKYPFIYKVDDLFYFLGWGICKQCKDELAIQYYERFIQIAEEIGEERLASKKCDVDEIDLLLYYFRKVMAYSDIAVEDSDMPKFRKELNVFLDSCDLAQKKDMEHQLMVFINVFYYYLRRNE